MGTEIAISFISLRAQLENEKSSLYKIDESLKKIVTTGRFSDRFNNSSGDYSRGGQRAGGRNSFSDSRNEDFNKRKHEAKTVFSRLSARNDSDNEEAAPGQKRFRMSSTVSRELPSRAEVLRAQGDDAQTRTRNRRMFGSLLGTLQKFKQEEIVLHTKEEKKAQVERKIEEQARLEKEREKKERKTLFAEREHKKATIKALEAKMMRVQEFEQWEASQKSLGNFILTKAKPHIYWAPGKMSDSAAEKLNSSKKFHEKCMARKRQELQEELLRIEQRCQSRIRGVKENNPDASMEESKDDDDQEGNKRNKFAMDVDEKEKDSDTEERHKNGDVKEVQSEESKENETAIGEPDQTMESDQQEDINQPMDTNEQTDEVQIEMKDSLKEKYNEEHRPGENEENLQKENHS